MKTIEEKREKLLTAKVLIEEKLERLERVEEPEPITLRSGYESEREKLMIIPQTSLCNLDLGTLYIADPSGRSMISLVSTRLYGPLADKAFSLNEDYDWNLGRDEEDTLCLVPIKRVKKTK